jgi:hypothetical protein
MGLFSFRKKKRISVPEGRCLRAYSGWADRDELTAWKVGGDEEKTLYVYDPSLLSGIRKGDRFTVTVSPGDAIIVSTLTGTEWNTQANGDVLVEYWGSALGTIRMNPDIVREIAQDGYMLSFDCEIVGKVSRGCPEVVAYCDFNELEEWAESREDFGSSLAFPNGLGIETVHISSPASEWLLNPLSRSVNRISLRLMPKEKGSSAKQHIMIERDGKDMLEVSARKNGYKELLAHVNSKASAIAYSTEWDNDVKRIHMNILFDSDL